MLWNPFKRKPPVEPQESSEERQQKRILLIREILSLENPYDDKKRTYLECLKVTANEFTKSDDRAIAAINYAIGNIVLEASNNELKLETPDNKITWKKIEFYEPHEFSMLVLGELKKIEKEMETINKHRDRVSPPNNQQRSR